MVAEKRGRWRRKRVAVVLGGMSPEHEISEMTGEAVARALSDRGYDIRVLRADRKLARRLSEGKIHVVFNALHGRFGEDGCIQGLCEMMRIPYTGSGVTASALSMSKSLTKRVWEHLGLQTPPWTLVRRPEAVDARMKLPARLPVVVKPDGEGSSLGVSIVRKRQDLARAIETAREFARDVLVEKYVAGKEVTVGILDDQALEPMEVVPKGEFHSYEVKYTADREEFVLPAGLPAAARKRAAELALEAYRAADVRSYARVDLRVDSRNEPWLIELNTLPGLTGFSYLPHMAAHEGVSYGELVERILDGAALNVEEAA